MNTEKMDVSNNPPLVNLGMGFNTISGLPTGNTCVETPKDSWVANEGGQHVVYELEKARSQEESRHAFSRSGSAAFALGWFSLGGGASSRGGDTTTITGLHYAARVIVENAVRNLPTPHPLTPAALSTLEKDGLAAFLRVCGNRFIIAEYAGGALMATLTAKDLTASESEEVSDNANIKIGVFTGQVEFKNSVHTVETRTYSQFRIEGLGAEPPTQDIETAAEQFPALVSSVKGGHPWTLAIVFQRYSSVLPTRTDIDHDSEIGYIAQLSQLFDSLSSESTVIKRAIAFPDEFEPLDTIAARARLSLLTATLKKLELLARACAAEAAEPGACGQSPPVVSDFPLPRPIPARGALSMSYPRVGDDGIAHAYTVTGVVSNAVISLTQTPDDPGLPVVHDNSINYRGVFDQILWHATPSPMPAPANGMGFLNVEVVGRSYMNLAELAKRTLQTEYISFATPRTSQMGSPTDNARCARILVDRHNNVRFLVSATRLGGPACPS